MHAIAYFENFVSGNGDKTRNIRCINALRSCADEALEFSEIRFIYLACWKQSFTAYKIHERKRSFDE